MMLVFMVWVICCFVVFMVCNCLLIVGFNGILVWISLLVVSWILLSLVNGNLGYLYCCKIFIGILCLFRLICVWCCGVCEILVVVFRMFFLVNVFSLLIFIVLLLVVSVSDGWWILIWLNVVVVVFRFVELF